LPELAALLRSTVPVAPVTLVRNAVLAVMVEGPTMLGAAM
jgi:hypothetical protein